MVTELWVFPAAQSPSLAFLGLPQKHPASSVLHSGVSVFRGTFLTQSYELSRILAPEVKVEPNSL